MRRIKSNLSETFIVPSNISGFLLAFLYCCSASGEVFVFSGDIEAVTVDSGQSVFSGTTLDQPLWGHIGIDSLSGTVRVNFTPIGGLTCCVLASGSTRINNQSINTETANFYNGLQDQTVFAAGDVVDLVDTELDRILSDESRIQLRVLLVLTKDAFDEDLSYTLNTNDVLIAVSTVIEEIGGESVFSAFGAVFYDSDGDSVPDYQDNCTLVANPAQIDTDGDGIGNRCDADIDNNCIVNFLDFAFYPPAFNSGIGSPNYNADVDFNSSGVIEFLDLVVLQSGFFSPPGPSNVPCE